MPVEVKDPNRLISSRIKAGKVIFQDEFERASNLMWEAFAADAGGTAVLDGTDRRAFRGEKSCKITTGATSGFRADMRRRFGHVPTGKMAMEFMFSSPESNAQYIEFGAYTFDGTWNKVFALRYHFVAKKWYYFNSAGSFVELQNAAQDLSSQELDLFHYVLFAFDVKNLKLLSLVCDELVVDLSSIPAYQTSSATVPYVRFYIRLATNAASATNLWIDDVVISELTN